MGSVVGVPICVDVEKATFRQAGIVQFELGPVWELPVVHEHECGKARDVIWSRVVVISVNTGNTADHGVRAYFDSERHQPGYLDHDLLIGGGCAAARSL